MKQIILKSLMLIAVLLTSNAVCAYDFESGGIYYNIHYSSTDSNKTVEVTYKGSSYSAFSDEYTGNIVIPETVTYGGTTYSVTNIGKSAFSGCSSFEHFSFGSGMKSIGDESFSDCTAMTKLISRTVTPPTCGIQALDDINKWSCELYVPQSAVSAYQGAEQWKEFFFIIGTTSDINDILYNDENSPVEYYNLNDVKVENPEKGIFIKRQGGKTTKVVK